MHRSFWSILWPFLAGFAAIAVGIFGNRFYAADVWGGDVGDKKPIPKWLGRLLCILVGIFFLVAGPAPLFVD
jgi:hypothetical protein